MKIFTSAYLVTSVALLAAGFSACQLDPIPGEDDQTPLEAYERQSLSSAVAEYGTLSDEQKLSLWSEQLDRILAEPLTAKERSIVTRVQSELPLWLSMSGEALEARMVEELIPELGEDFTREVFGTLGDSQVRADYVASLPEEAVFRSQSCDTRWCTLAFGNVSCCGCEFDSNGTGCGWFNQQPCTKRYCLN